MVGLARHLDLPVAQRDDAGHETDRGAGSFQPPALFDVELQVGGHVPPSMRCLGDSIGVDVVGGQHLPERCSVGRDCGSQLLGGQVSR